jgi:drug/metabolite transporter (DMT)-like permease
MSTTATISVGRADEPSGRAAGVVATLGATAFWSFGSVLGVAADVSGVVLGFWRMWIALAFLSLIVLVTRRFPSWHDIRRAAPMGVLFGFNLCAFFITLQYVSIAVALIIGALTPVVALPIAVFFLGERLTPMKVICAVAAVAGVVGAILASPPNDDGGNTAIGYLWAVASLFIWVAYLFAGKSARRQVETVRLLWASTLAGSVTVSVIAIVVRADLSEMHGIGWLWVTLMALGPGILGHGLFAWAQPRIDSSVSSVLIQGEPVGAALAAWVFLDQPVTLAQMLWMAVVLVALGVLAYREAREDILVVDDALA